MYREDILSSPLQLGIRKLGWGGLQLLQIQIKKISLYTPISSFSYFQAEWEDSGMLSIVCFVTTPTGSSPFRLSPPLQSLHLH